MIKHQTEIVIIGSGFGGTLVAMLLKKIGRQAVLLEKHSHPRFAIGESSTPLANLTLERLCKHYDLSEVLPMCKYGPWQEKLPQVTCGLKRGFTFFKHSADTEFPFSSQHSNQLLVEASASNEMADTHWFRADVDHFLLQQAQQMGIPYLDQFSITSISENEDWVIIGEQQGETVEITCKFIINAGGEHNTLGLDTITNKLQTCSASVFNHFRGVCRWERLCEEITNTPNTFPFPLDDAALHHITDEGWMWLLRFNNDITSAGFVLHPSVFKDMNTSQPEHLWNWCLERFPSIAQQFTNAQPVQTYRYTPRLQRLDHQFAGKNWASLPHAGYFIDPLFSSGIAHSLLGIERLLKIILQHWGTSQFLEKLKQYESYLMNEVFFLDKLIDGCYMAMPCFELFVDFSMYYFAGAHWSENRYISKQANDSDQFLNSHNPDFRQAVFNSYGFLKQMQKKKQVPNSEQIRWFRKKVSIDIEPYNIAGLCDANKNNVYLHTEPAIT